MQGDYDNEIKSKVQIEQRELTEEEQKEIVNISHKK